MNKGGKRVCSFSNLSRLEGNVQHHFAESSPLERLRFFYQTLFCLCVYTWLDRRRSLLLFVIWRIFAMFKPVVLVVVPEQFHDADGRVVGGESLLVALSTWIRSHGCDVCACLETRVPPLRCWPDRFVCALLPGPELLAGTRSPVDTWYLESEATCPARLLPWLHAALLRGGVGVVMRRIGSTRPRWGCYRQVRGCGLDLFHEQKRNWDGALLAYPGRRALDLRARA
jgi:hypothetical protein